MSLESCEAILKVLSNHYQTVGYSIVDSVADLETLVATEPDLVFLGLEYITLNDKLGADDPDKIWLSDYLDERKIAYTGSAQLAHELERNKPLAKQRVLDHNLNTAAFCVIKKDQILKHSDVTLDYPLFIKPSNRGGGLGIDSNSVVYNYQQLQTKVCSITTTYNSDVLIEEYLPGREFSVAILMDQQSLELVAMPIELIAPVDKKGSRLLSRSVKSSNAETVLIINDEVTKLKINELAINVFKSLGARDYGRIDIRLDGLGVPFFLEANLIPSLITNYGSFPKACVLNIEMEYEPMILSIVNLALVRSEPKIKKLALESDSIQIECESALQIMEAV